MKSLNQYIKERLIINKDYHDNMIVIKSVDELRKIIKDRYKKLGPGTEQNPIDFNDIDVSNLDSFYDKNAGKFGKGLFENIQFKYIDISDWDVSNVMTMNCMFAYCIELKSVGDISKWNVSKVTNMYCMFLNCKFFNQDLSGWDVSSVTYMGYMFCGCESFNQDISNWNVSKVNNMNNMFYCCKKFNQDLSGWNVSNVTDASDIFDDCAIKDKYKPKFK